MTTGRSGPAGRAPERFGRFLGRRASPARTFDHALARWASAGLRLSLGSAFLSAIADRFGWWGPYGSGAVGWGDMARFSSYDHELVPFASGPPLAFLAWSATGLEALLGACLVLGARTAWAAAASALLLAVFGVCMAVFTGLERPLTYSVFTASAAAVALVVLVRQEERAERA